MTTRTQNAEEYLEAIFKLQRGEEPVTVKRLAGELGTLVATGKLKYRETIAQGLASAPEAFMGLLKGRNFGKQLVKLI